MIKNPNPNTVQLQAEPIKEINGLFKIGKRAYRVNGNKVEKYKYSCLNLAEIQSARTTGGKEPKPLWGWIKTCSWSLKQFKEGHVGWDGNTGPNLSTIKQTLKIGGTKKW